MCLYCVKYRIIAGRLADSHRSPAMLCCLMAELTFAHVNKVLSLCDKFYNEPSSGKHCVECYECLTVKTRPVWGIINDTLPIFILCDNVVHYGLGGDNGWQHCTMGWCSIQYTLSCGHCRGQDSCGEWETLLRVRAWECLEFGGQAVRAQHSLGRRHEAAQRLGLAWQWARSRTGWPAESHHYSSTWDQLRAARAGVHVTTIHPHTTQTGQGWTCDPGGGCVTTRDGGCVTQSEVWQWLASVRSNVFIIYYTTRSMLLSLYIASEHWARAHNIPQQTIFDIRS